MPPESESQTRRSRIDTKLDARGWPQPPNGVIPIKTSYRLPEIETTTGPADYGLFNDEGLMAIVEAKKLTLGPQNVLSQAERYAEGARGPYEVGKYGVPFIYSTNGEVIWFHDLRDPLNRSRQVADFHSPAAMEEMLDFRPDSGARLAVEQPERSPSTARLPARRQRRHRAGDR